MTIYVAEIGGHDRTDQCCRNVKKVLANQVPSTHDPNPRRGRSNRTTANFSASAINLRLF